MIVEATSIIFLGGAEQNYIKPCNRGVTSLLEMIDGDD